MNASCPPLWPSTGRGRRSSGHFPAPARAGAVVAIALAVLPFLPAAPRSTVSLSAAESQQVTDVVAKPDFKRLPKNSQLMKALAPVAKRFGGKSDASSLVLQQLAQSGLAADSVYVDNTIRSLETPRIYVVNGEADLDDAHPDCVAIGPTPFKYCCSGTLIAPRLVLTAGHCLRDCAGYVFVGNSVTGAGQRIKVVGMHRHPEYREDPIGHDISVLILEHPALGVAPRQIAVSAEVDAANEAWIVGFGTTNPEGTAGFGKRRAAGPVVFADANNAKFGANPSTELVLGTHPATLLQANDLSGTDTCSGDSGGPVYIFVGGYEVLAGATSRSIANMPLCGGGGIYTRCDRYLDWIAQVAKDAGVDPPKTSAGTQSE